MGNEYARKKVGGASRTERSQSAAPAAASGMSMDVMRSMLMSRAMDDRSHRIDLPDAMRAKMESAFGMNFGKVNLYESERVADAGANAIAQGGNIAFAPGKADFNTVDGRNRLGHELSHIASQARGEVTGSGYLNNSALEARADREGAMAASGEQVYSGPMMDAPSFAGVSAPMQADDDEEEKKKGALETVMDWAGKGGGFIDDYVPDEDALKKIGINTKKIADGSKSKTALDFLGTVKTWATS